MPSDPASPREGELLGCPHCGGPPHHDQFEIQGGHAYCCEACDTIGPMAATDAAAIAAWNRRALQPAPESEGELVEVVARALDEAALYTTAMAVVIATQKGSTALVQRSCGIGYNQAVRLVERMEAEGILGKPNSAGKRDVLTMHAPTHQPTITALRAAGLAMGAQGRKRRRMLLLSSYCGGEPGCTNDLPCRECLKMSNVVVADAEIVQVLGGWEYLRLSPIPPPPAGEEW